MARFYQRLGFEAHFRLPSQGDAGYVGLRRGSYELAVTTIDSPEQLIGVQVGSGPRFEMFVYVDDVDETLAGLRDGDVRVLKEPEDMFWGERVAWIADPDGTLSPLPPPDQPKPPSPEQVPEQLRTSSR